MRGPDGPPSRLSAGAAPSVHFQASGALLANVAQSARSTAGRYEETVMRSSARGGGNAAPCRAPSLSRHGASARIRDAKRAGASRASRAAARAHSPRRNVHAAQRVSTSASAAARGCGARGVVAAAAARAARPRPCNLQGPSRAAERGVWRCARGATRCQGIARREISDGTVPYRSSTSFMLSNCLGRGTGAVVTRLGAGPVHATGMPRVFSKSGTFSSSLSNLDAPTYTAKSMGHPGSSSRRLTLSSLVGLPRRYAITWYRSSQKLQRR